MSGLPRAARAEETRARILEAALTAFAARGFHGTSTRDISAACGLSPAALYVHYDSKEQLLFAISRAGHLETLEVVTAAAAVSDEPVERLEHVVRAYVLFHIRRATLARVINYEMAALTDEHRAAIHTIRRRIDRVIGGIIEQGVRHGSFDTTEPREVARAIESLGIDIARWYDTTRARPTPALADSYAAMALRMVLKR